MAWQFIRLKLRVTGRILGTGSAWSILGTVAVWLLALFLGLGGGVLVAAAALYLDRSPVWAVLVGAAVQGLWVLVPVVASAIDATINPRWFELLPLSSGELGRGLLAAGMVGPGGLASVLLIGIGLGVGYWPGWWGVIAVPVGAILITFIGVVSGRLATTLLSDLLARTNGAVLGPLVGLLMGLMVVSATRLLPRGGSVSAESLVPAWAESLAAIPGGGVGWAMAHLAGGNLTRGGVGLAWGVVAAGLLAWAHGREVGRLQTRAVTQRTGRVRGMAGSTLGHGLARLVPSGDLRVAAAKEGRYLLRDPRLRAQIVGGVVTVAVFASVGALLMPSAYAPFVAVAVTWAIVTSLTPNQFGVDAGSFWVYVASPTNVATVLAGKNIMWALAAAPLAVVAAVGGSIVAGSARFLIASLLLSAAVALIWMAVGNMTSIFGPFPLPERQVFSTGPTAGRAIAVSLGGLAVSGGLTAPVIVVLALAIYFGGAWGATLAGLAGLGYASILFRVGFHWAQSAVAGHQLEILESLDRP